jgi:hypothetical protein
VNRLAIGNAEILDNHQCRARLASKGSVAVFHDRFSFHLSLHRLSAPCNLRVPIVFRMRLQSLDVAVVVLDDEAECRESLVSKLVQIDDFSISHDQIP